MNREHTTASSINTALESDTGKLSLTIAKVAVTALITTLLTISTNMLSEMNKRQLAQEQANVRQELNIQALQQLTASQQRVIDANSTSVRSVGEQVLRNTDAIEHLREMNSEYLRRQRP